MSAARGAENGCGSTQRGLRVGSYITFISPIPATPSTIAVMHARDDRGPAAFETIDNGQVPQRAIAIHQWREDLARQVRQLLLRAGRIDPNPADMIAEIEIGIVLPSRDARSAAAGTSPAAGSAGISGRRASS